MLERYHGKEVRVYTAGGETFTGTAEACPSGWGLHEFGVEEESLAVGDAQLFLSDIEKIEEIRNDAAPGFTQAQRFAAIGTLLEGPYYVADVLPRQVPKEARGQYFAVEKYFLQPERLAALRRKFAGILLRYNCYLDMEVSFDNCETWETNPAPAAFAERLEALAPGAFLRALFPGRG